MRIPKRVREWQMDRAINRYMREAGKYDCGVALALHISPTLGKLKSRMTELALKVGPGAGHKDLKL